MTQISDRPENRHADQTGSPDGSKAEVLMDEAEAEELAAAMQESFLMIEFYTWRARRLANRQDKKYPARERIRQIRENGYRQGRGKYIFVISRPTFVRIIKYIRSLNTRSSREVCRILILMYKYGKDFSKTGPQVDRRTSSRYLLAAFKALGIATGVRKEPSLWSLKSSHNLLRDAKIAGVDLETELFLIV